MTTSRTIKIAPSILNADFCRLGEQIASVEAGGADWLHLDVMDGHFVPNLSFGVPVVASIATRTKLFLDAHLMIANPERYVAPFVEAGAHSVTFHVEATNRPRALVEQVRGLGAKVGVALNPGTPVEAILEFVDELDLVLVMTVWPGFGGQKFMPECLRKVELLASRLRPDQALQVDGGINLETAPLAVAAGADTLVVGAVIFRGDDPTRQVGEIRRAAGKSDVALPGSSL